MKPKTMSIKTVLKTAKTHYEIKQIFSEYRDSLDLVEDRIKSVLGSDAKKLTEISSYLLNLGGKRVRPLLCLLSADLYAPSDTQIKEVIDVAAGIELIHMATLLHDDIIDKSPTRRGKPSAYLEFGCDATLLAGDFLFVRAFGLCGMLDKFTIKATEFACGAVIEGEELEGFLEKDVDYPMERYLDVINKKTSALFALSSKIGAHQVKASKEEVEKLHNFGLVAGTAFQIVDDILDITADEKTLGKTPGNDLRQSTPTIINLLWLDKCKEDAENYFFNTEDKSDISAAIKSIEESGVLSEAKQMAVDYTNRAVTILDSLNDVSQKQKDMLLSILNFTLERTY